MLDGCRKEWRAGVNRKAIKSCQSFKRGPLSHVGATAGCRCEPCVGGGWMLRTECREGGQLRRINGSTACWWKNTVGDRMMRSRDVRKSGPPPPCLPWLWIEQIFRGCRGLGLRDKQGRMCVCGSALLNEDDLVSLHVPKRSVWASKTFLQVELTHHTHASASQPSLAGRVCRDRPTALSRAEHWVPHLKRRVT